MRGTRSSNPASSSGRVCQPSVTQRRSQICRHCGCRESDGTRNKPGGRLIRFALGFCCAGILGRTELPSCLPPSSRRFALRWSRVGSGVQKTPRTRSAPTRFIPASCRGCAHPVAPPIQPCGPNACASFRCAGREKVTRWPMPFCSWLPISRPTSQVRKSTWMAELSPYRPAPRHEPTDPLPPLRRVVSYRLRSASPDLPALAPEGEIRPQGRR